MFDGGASPMSGRRVAVTGAAGYIGSVLCPALLDRGWSVLALDLLLFGRDGLAACEAHPSFQFRELDTRDIEPEMLAGVDAVVDLASITHEPSGELWPELVRSTNALGRERVARAASAAGATRYLVTSSCAAYGATSGRALDEDSACSPGTHYARSCLECERLVLPLSSPLFSASVVRQGTVFGASPKMRFDLVVNAMTLHAWRSGRLTVHGTGLQWRPFVHVKDAAAAIMKVLEAPADQVGGQIFNVVGKCLTVSQVAELVRESVPRPIEVVHDFNAGDSRDYLATASKIKSALGWEPTMKAVDGIQEVWSRLEAGAIDIGQRTNTGAWYKELAAKGHPGLMDRTLQRSR